MRCVQRRYLKTLVFVVLLLFGPFKIRIPGEDITLITESTNRNFIVGNDRVRKDIEAVLGRCLLLHTHRGYSEKIFSKTSVPLKFFIFDNISPIPAFKSIVEH